MTKDLVCEAAECKYNLHGSVCGYRGFIVLNQNGHCKEKKEKDTEERE